MGFRFQKRIKILPSITLNLSKSGVSTSVGVKGAHLNFGRGQTRTTVGLPGSGLSHTTINSDGSPKASVEPVANLPASPDTPAPSKWGVVFLVATKILSVIAIAGAAIVVIFVALSGSSAKGRKRR